MQVELEGLQAVALVLEEEVAVPEDPMDLYVGASSPHRTLLQVHTSTSYITGNQFRLKKWLDELYQSFRKTTLTVAAHASLPVAFRLRPVGFELQWPRLC